MRTARQRLHPLIYILIGLLIGGGFGLILFWGFPTVGSISAAQPTLANGPVPESESVQVGGANAQTGLYSGAPAPDFALEDVTGKQYRLSDLRGKVVLLNFWATWCAPCLVEMPLLEAEYKESMDDDFLVLAVNDGEPLDQVKAFGAENGLSFPLLLDPGSVVQRLYKVRGYPSSVFIDEKGRIQIIHIGLMQERQLRGYLAELEFSS